MILDIVVWLNFGALVLAILLVSLSALQVNSSRKGSMEGNLKELSKNIYYAMLMLLGILLVELLKLTLPSPPDNVMGALELIDTAFIILTALCILKVASLIVEISRMFDVEAKEEASDVKLPLFR